MFVDIGIWARRRPIQKAAGCRIKDLHTQRIARGGIVRMSLSTVATRTGGERAEQVDFSKKFQIITGADWTGFHEILMGIVGKACAHKDIQDIMNIRLSLIEWQMPMRSQSAGQIGMAAVMIICAFEQAIGIGVTTGADHIMHAAAIRIKSIPSQCVMGDRGEWPQGGKPPPKLVPSG